MSNEPSVVLLVDDDVLVRNLARRNLEEAGFSVLSAADADEAMTISREYTAPIHAAVVDIELPGLDGIALAQQIVSERAGMVILLMSAGTNRTIPEHMSFIAKPFTRSELTWTLTDLLARRSGQMQADDSESNAALDHQRSAPS